MDNVSRILRMKTKSNPIAMILIDCPTKCTAVLRTRRSAGTEGDRSKVTTTIEFHRLEFVSDVSSPLKWKLERTFNTEIPPLRE